MSSLKSQTVLSDFRGLIAVFYECGGDRRFQREQKEVQQVLKDDVEDYAELKPVLLQTYRAKIGLKFRLG